jgi:hypothetical protein
VTPTPNGCHEFFFPSHRYFLSARRTVCIFSTVRYQYHTEYLMFLVRSSKFFCTVYVSILPPISIRGSYGIP